MFEIPQDETLVYKCTTESTDNEETIYERYFSTKEKIIDFIASSCVMDCYMCTFNFNHLPCSFTFSGITKEQVKEWLDKEAEV